MGCIKLNKQNFFDNLNFYSSKCTKDKLCIALKDNAYGHGLEQIASMLQEYGVNHVFVRNNEEAQKALKYGFKSILILYDIPLESHKNFIISINSLHNISKIPSNSNIELKIDTGMNRNGIYPHEIKEALKLIEKYQLNLYGVFTHFCCADEDDNITKQQELLFLDTVSNIKKIYKNEFRIHCANSAGVFKVNMDQYNLARIGIGVYGYVDTKENQYLKPVLSLHANKITTKHLKKGDHVGYGSKAFVASKDMNVSNYDIGYGDGLFRFSENKKAAIANKLPILGRVSMDSFSVESTDDEVCIFDDVTHMATQNQTIIYEVLTSLKSNIKRKIV